MNLRPYVAIARPDHWFKNIFVLPGILIAVWLHPEAATWSSLPILALALLGVCLVASSNYALNEVLDAERDRLHPVKKARPLAARQISSRAGIVEWLLLAAAGLAVGWLVNLPFFVTLCTLWIMGIVYNVPPVRTKEVPYLDVLSEAVNNPLRMLLGWYATGVTSFPPSSLLLAYWMVGSYLMMAKRLAEYRTIGDPASAAAYRSSFRVYNEPRMLALLVCYASGFMFFVAVVLVKFHPEFILACPLLMVYLAYYTQLTLRPDSIVQTPENLFQDRHLLYLTLLVSLVLVVLAFIDIPWIGRFLEIDTA
jgi:4-hydroxybenzoate polyprenyltransferase